jgi:phosphoglycolate phosphatase-like HAD superfamily hydrolase
MSELTTLLFDVDGTLADTERDGHRVDFNRAFSDAGLNWHWDVSAYGRLLDVTRGKNGFDISSMNFSRSQDRTYMDASFRTRVPYMSYLLMEESTPSIWN